MPAVVVLNRLPVPAVAFEGDGTIVFANDAFAEMLGYELDAIRTKNFHHLSECGGDHAKLRTAVSGCGQTTVMLRHRDGSDVIALMSESALKRRDDPLVLTTFHDMTEQLWMNPRLCTGPP